ncbi:hypothetical protein XENOCAPTIV_014467, partial [Xenoophorus captivus]
VCCSCCAIGLWMRSEGRGCNTHKYLSYPCGHIFLSCCEEDEGQSQLPLWSEKKSWPTALPRRGMIYILQRTFCPRRTIVSIVLETWPHTVVYLRYTMRFTHLDAGHLQLNGKFTH